MYHVNLVGVIFPAPAALVLALQFVFGRKMKRVSYTKHNVVIVLTVLENMLFEELQNYISLVIFKYVYQKRHLCLLPNSFICFTISFSEAKGIGATLLTELIASRSMTQLVLQPTRSLSFLDLIFTTARATFGKCQIERPISFSDHSSVVIEIFLPSRMNIVVKPPPRRELIIKLCIHIFQIWTCVL